jgi:hypothetical protein
MESRSVSAETSTERDHVMSRKLYEFNANFGRMGALSGRFVLGDGEQALLAETYGQEIYFGEVLGKHSEVFLELKPEHITVVTDDEAFLAQADALKIDLSHGLNPLDYLPEGDD